MRDNRIDFVRALCSLTVIIAHVSAPAWINDIRTFDVVALVLISGMSLIYSSQVSYRTYIWKRMKKLYFPTCLMMMTVFGGSYAVCSVLGIKQLYSSEQILRSFLLLNEGSMGYVWIVRVYIAIAILTPLILIVAEKSRNIHSFLLVNTFCVLLSSLVYFSFSSMPSSIIKTAFMDWGYSSIVYSIIAYEGVWLITNKNRINNCLMISLFAFICCTLVLSIQTNQFIFNPGNYKFPPRLYYCIYGILIGLVLYRIAPEKEYKIIKWISVHSFSIYLWHIIFLHAYGVVAKISILSPIESMWLLEYMVVTICAIVATRMVEYAKNKLALEK